MHRHLVGFADLEGVHVGHLDAQAAAAALEVEDFPAAMARIAEHKVKVTMPATETPVCWMALIEDPDGNPVMIHRRKNR